MKPVSADGEFGSCEDSACVGGSNGCGCDDIFAIKKNFFLKLIVLIVNIRWY